VRIDRIAQVLTRELLSHDYLIGRREARNIGLPVTDASDTEAKILWELYEDVAQELKLAEPWNLEKEAQATQPRVSIRGVLESDKQKHVFSSTYQIKRVTVAQGPGGGKKVDVLQTTTLEECWKEV
jgi:hypothetical protein